MGKLYEYTSRIKNLRETNKDLIELLTDKKNSCAIFHMNRENISKGEIINLDDLAVNYARKDDDYKPWINDKERNRRFEIDVKDKMIIMKNNDIHYIRHLDKIMGNWYIYEGTVKEILDRFVLTGYSFCIHTGCHYSSEGRKDKLEKIEFAKLF